MKDKKDYIKEAIYGLVEEFGTWGPNTDLVVEDILTDLFDYGFSMGYGEAMDYVHGGPVCKTKNGSL